LRRVRSVMEASRCSFLGTRLNRFRPRREGDEAQPPCADFTSVAVKLIGRLVGDAAAARIDNDHRPRARVGQHGRTRMAMAEETRKKLTAGSTATLTTGLFKRGFRTTLIPGIHRLKPAPPAI